MTTTTAHPVVEEWEEALRSYAQAVDLAPHNDWQPRLRLGLLLQRMGRFEAGVAGPIRAFLHFPFIREPSLLIEYPAHIHSLVRSLA